ncbi:hypothetical protein [Snodgrassella alvi]|uniref:hypothetical protein n=1 Tax=Snodgrassella alvi TaxID=1196083 RepID=UPI00117AC968|nr:hypothetical protein [Snodgrassella alvi]
MKSPLIYLYICILLVTVNTLYRYRFFQPSSITYQIQLPETDSTDQNSKLLYRIIRRCRNETTRTAFSNID